MIHNCSMNRTIVKQTWTLKITANKKYLMKAAFMLWKYSYHMRTFPEGDGCLLRASGESCHDSPEHPKCCEYCGILCWYLNNYRREWEKLRGEKIPECPYKERIDAEMDADTICTACGNRYCERCDQCDHCWAVE